MERWRVGVIPETRGMQPPVKRVERPQLNHVTLLPALMPKTIICPVGPNVMRPLIKLQSFERTGSLDTFLMQLATCIGTTRACFIIPVRV